MNAWDKDYTWLFYSPVEKFASLAMLENCATASYLSDHWCLEWLLCKCVHFISGCIMATRRTMVMLDGSAILCWVWLSVDGCVLYLVSLRPLLSRLHL